VAERLATAWSADPALAAALVAAGLHPASAADAGLRVARWPAQAMAPWLAVIASAEEAEAALHAGAIEVATEAELGWRSRRALQLWRERTRLAAYAELFALSRSWMEIVDPGFRLLDVNPAFEAHSGVSRADAIGRTTAELFRADTHAPAFYQSVAAALRGEGRWAGTLIARRLDGGLSFQDAALARVAVDGRVVGYVAEKRVDIPSEPDPQEVSAALQRAASATLVVQDGVVQDASPALLALLDRARADLVGTLAAQLELEPVASAVQVEVGASVRVRAKWQVRGAWLDVEVVVTGAVAGMHAFQVWTVHDVSRQMDSERQFARAVKAASDASLEKSRFLARMSHELRTPLNAIIGYSELLLEDATGESVADLRRILGAASHLLGLVNDLLDLTRIEQGQSRMHLEQVPVAAIVDRVVVTCTPGAARTGTALVVDADPDLSVWGDVQRVGQVLINLVGNACKFTAQGTVTLRARARGGSVHFEVEDTGIGMTRAACARIFQPFVQADDTIHARYGGTGLGLTISRELVLQMGGEIGVRSQVGVGSTFWVRLPATAPAGA
jgi:PAS domain S-box-containing protein